MIWRLTYCNKKGVEARIDIIRGNRTPIEIVQGSGQPFTLAYKLDKNDKSGHIMTSSADIEIFETDTFNIDDLKTSNETELKVEYFEDNALTWEGFILPDFFSREIGSPNIVRMTASDRLTALKGVTLSDLPSRISLRDLIELCLAQTGLDLGLVSQIQINQGSTNILDSEVLSQRLTDVRGRSISCYDILMSIMVATHSTIRQRAGQWQVYNKLEHELRTPTIYFDKVERGAIRTIQPVASSVGIFQEYGGGRLHPDNYDFAQGVSGWVNKNGFSYTISNQKPVSYSVGTPNHTVTFGESDRNRMMIMGVVNPFWKPDTAPHVENTFPVITSNEDSVKITIDISVLGWGYWGSGSTGRFIILAENGSSRLAFNPNSGQFEEFDNEATSSNSSEPPYVIRLTPSASKVGDIYPVTNKSIKYETVLEQANLSDYTISIRIYGTSGFSGPTAPLFIDFANVKFSNAEEAPKGTIFKTIQGSNFTKEHEIGTVLWGDYLNSGLNGYFYNYPIDDTSSLHLPSGELSSPTWITAFDTTERPLLHHISRQKSRLFSVAHDILKANINVESFDPLAVFQDCKGGKYVVVSASFDFLRSEVNVELEQIAYDNNILKRDYIYSYFGEGEDTIKSIGGIAGGGGGTGGGGGMTSEQLEMLTNLADWWKLDAENDAIYSLKSVYSLKGISALGLGSGGGGGGDGDFDRLDAWADYTEPKAGWVLSALLGYDLHTRVNSLEAGGGASNIDIAITGSGNAVTDVSLSGNTLTFAKSSTFALSTHNHAIANITGLQDALDGKEPSFTKNTAFNKNFGTTVGTVSQGNHLHTGVYEPSFTKNTAFNKNFGTASGTVAQGNDSRINNGQTAFGWGNHASAGYALNSALTAHTGNSTIHITATERTNWNDSNSKKHTHSNKALLDLITQSNIDVLSKLSIVDGNIKVDTTLWATGGISALGLGSGGGGGGGVDMLDSWANYTTAKANYYVPASLLVPFRSDTLSRLTSLESGSATSIVTTGSGNAITSLTKSGSVITATKGLSFALASHTHTIAQVTGLQGALDLKATPSDITTAISAIEIGGRNLLLDSWGDARSDGLASRYTLSSKIENGEDFVVRIKVKENTSIVWGNPDFYTQVIDGVNNQIRIGYLTEVSKGLWELKGTWDNKTGDAIEEVTFFMRGGSRPDFEVEWAKLEKGTKATDWTPAPEDQVGDWNVTDVNSFAFIKNKPTQLSQFTDNIGVGTHIANKANPHSVTKAQVGLSNVDNVKQATKSEFDSHTANKANPHAVTKSQVGLGNADNTSDLLKPISNATQIALNGKLSLTGGTLSGNLKISDTNSLQTLILESTTGSQDTGSGIGFTAWSGVVKGAIGFIRDTNYGRGSLRFYTNSDADTLDVTENDERMRISYTGNVGIGTTSPLYKLDVAGTGRFTSSLITPKVDFGNGFTIEPSGTELVFKYNGVIKQRMLTDGTILATGGMTALST